MGKYEKELRVAAGDNKAAVDQRLDIRVDEEGPFFFPVFNAVGIRRRRLGHYTEHLMLNRRAKRLGIPRRTDARSEDRHLSAGRAGLGGDRSLRDIILRAFTDTTIVALRRDGVSIPNPSAGQVLLAGDIIYLMGTARSDGSHGISRHRHGSASRQIRASRIRRITRPGPPPFPPLSWRDERVLQARTNRPESTP